MLNMIMIEGIKIKARPIPKKKLISIWKTLSDEPFPKVKALQLDGNDFDRVMQLKRCEEDERRELEEWGRVLTNSGTDACVFNVNEFANTEYVILVRENPYHSLGEILKHELAHVAAGDL